MNYYYKKANGLILQIYKAYKNCKNFSILKLNKVHKLYLQVKNDC